jgi:HEAT repeat protein
MHTDPALRRIHLLVLILGWLLFMPREGNALVSQSNAAQQEPAAPTPPAANPSSAQPPANQPAPASTTRGKIIATPMERAWQILEDACSGDKSGDRATAILVLGLIPNDSKSAKLAQKALTDERPEVRAAAAAALGNMPSRASIPKLKAAMDDQDPSVALAAAHSLDLMHDNSAYEVYYEILNGERKAGKGLIAAQTSMLRDPKKMAQFGFEEGIGFIPFAGIGWGAIKAIRKDDSSPVRAAAARVLARDPDPATTKALTEATGDNSWIVQVAAIEALAKRGDPSTLAAVERYMSDEKGAIKFTAAAAVIHLTAIKQAGTRKQRRTPDHKQP